jgi:chemotaxis family two-component system sensor kinase Cph1
MVKTSLRGKTVMSGFCSQQNSDLPTVLAATDICPTTVARLCPKGVEICPVDSDLSCSTNREQGLEARTNIAEDELARKVDELARSNRDLEQFAYAASHDLQEPLRMVATYTQLLGERYKGKLDDQADKYIHYAVEGALRMQTLIRDLLAFSVSGHQNTEVKAIDCNLVFRSALLNLAAAVEESGALISNDDLPIAISNASQLEQVFQNLIGNAIKFRNGTCPVIRVSVERKDAEWIFAIVDNGIGVTAEHPESVFTIFQRLHTREEYAGNGIGLAICKKIIERHGGRIWIESPPQGGTAFKFTLQAVESDATKTDRAGISEKPVLANR